MTTKKRPQYLDLVRIRLPLPGLISIMHRVSGAVLFLLIPLLLWLLQSSLGTPETFDAFRRTIASPLLKVVLLGLLWAYLHHLCAGVRHLALDLDLGTELAVARFSSAIVLAVSIGLTLIVGAMLW